MADRSVDVWINQSDRNVIIGRGSSVLLELRLRDLETQRRCVIKCTLDVEKARPLGLPVEDRLAQEFLFKVKKAAFNCLVDCTEDDFDKVGEALELLTEDMG